MYLKEQKLDCIRQDKNITLKEIQFLRGENKKLAENIQSLEKNNSAPAFSKSNVSGGEGNHEQLCSPRIPKMQQKKDSFESHDNFENADKENRNIKLKQCLISIPDFQNIVIPESSKENSPEKPRTKIDFPDFLDFKVSTGSLIPAIENRGKKEDPQLGEREVLIAVDENIENLGNIENFEKKDHSNKSGKNENIGHFGKKSLGKSQNE